ncbi:type II secretion system protein (plasmid) [Methylomarinum sp. Ch1-1]|uniref:Type II secretion system protein n=1 Tax=Methylomarinum roseum TaxID=3067653 RepID=A0AAU7P1P4_9GAMM|nr:type II secretion system protein [Methylomarinum sp. Ch1-1]MDP4523214.1 type II secretion system protein [Methylomarinum sp. Ch1-1]
MKSFKNQSGFTLVELIMVMGLLMLASALAIRTQVIEAQRLRADAMGKDIQTYNSAVRSFMVDKGASSVGNYAGVNWLKHAGSCAAGSASKAYLPCGFQSKTKWDKTFVTRIAFTGGDYVGTTQFSPISIGGVVRLDLANRAASKATTTNSANGAPIGGDSYTVDGAGRIIARATTNPGIDPWLRRDGSNSMSGSLNMGGNSISSALDINATRNIVANNNITAARNLRANSSITAGQDIYASRNITAAVNLRANRDISAGRNISATNNMYARDYWISRKGKYASQGVHYMTIARNGNYVPKPACNSSIGSSPQVFVTPVMYSDNSNGRAIGAVQVWASNAGSSWRINIRILVSSGWVSAPSSYRLAAVSTKCS